MCTDCIDMPIGSGYIRSEKQDGFIEGRSANVRATVNVSRLSRELPDFICVDFIVSSVKIFEINERPERFLQTLAINIREMLKSDFQFCVSGMGCGVISSRGRDRVDIAFGAMRVTSAYKDVFICLNIIGNSIAARLPKGNRSASTWYKRFQR